MSKVMDRAAEILGAAASIAACGHVGPDGDAFGSAVGFAYCARAAGKNAVVSFGEPFTISPNLEFIPRDVVVPASEFPKAPEVMVAFDTAVLHRLGSLAAAANAAGTLIVVDHHPIGEEFGDVRVVDAGAGAAAQITYHLIRRLGWPLPREAAIALWAGLVTDTGRFQYSSTSGDTLRVAADLVDGGVPVDEVGQTLFENLPFGYLSLSSRVLGRASLDPGRRFVWSVMTQEDLDECGLDYTAADPLIDDLRIAREADVALFVKQLPDGWRGSLRSRGRVDVAAIAAEFGGGGHHNAAGFTAPGPPQAIVDRIKALLDG